PLTSVWTVLFGPVLITCTLSRKKKTKTSLPKYTKLSMCLIACTAQNPLGRSNNNNNKEEQRSQDQTAFLHNAED
ncbi:unnamed protein product, partial [Staurois parvus]